MPVAQILAHKHLARVRIREKDAAYKTSTTIGVHKLSADAGMFVNAKVYGVLANLLIQYIREQP